VAEEMARLGMGVTPPDRELGGERLTAPEYDQLVRESAAKAHEILERQIKRPSWQRMPEDLRRERIRRVYESTRRASRARLLRARGFLPRLH
jgi:hypothetical protein